MAEPLVISARFNGPPGSANGGYFSGRAAELLAAELLGADSATVTLRRPPPLETALDSVRDGAGLRIMSGDVLIAEATTGTITTEPVAPISFDQATAAAADYGGLAEHPFPTCFSCGIAREDGLGLRPGAIASQSGRTAATWTPDQSLVVDRAIPATIVWAALDCPGGWTVDLVGRPMVLGRMTGHIASAPAPGERCVVVGRLDHRDGRKAFTSTSAYGENGRILGSAQATWIEIRSA